MRLQYNRKAAVSALRKSDQKLAQIIDRVGPFQLKTRNLSSPFETLMRSIIGQQLSGKAAASIYGRVIKLNNDQPPLPRQVLKTDDKAFRGAGMAYAKVNAIKDLASKTVDGSLPTAAELKRMPDDDVVDCLVAVRGIGPWTVHMLLIFYLGRPDILPVGDLGVRKGLQVAYCLEELPTPKERQKIGEKWRPYRSAASWYLWQAVDLELFQ